MTHMGVRTEYEMNSSRKRDYLTVWSGSFYSVYEAIGVSLPKMNGYMLTTYNDDRVRVTCPAPRNEHNYLEVDAAITKALNEHYARIGASSVIEPPKTIESHNEPLRAAMFARGCEWKVNKTTEHFTKDGEYEDYPVGYIRGPHYHGNGNPRPYSYSVQGPHGWLQMGFTDSEEGRNWALETAATILNPSK